MWRVDWAGESGHDLHGLPKKVAARIISKVDQSSGNPTRFFTRLVGSEYSKMRVGDYRVLALLMHETKVLSIQKVRHRKSVYK